MKKIIITSLISLVGFTLLMFSCQKSTTDVNTSDVSLETNGNESQINLLKRAIVKKGISITPISEEESQNLILTNCQPNLNGCSFLGKIQDVVYTPCKVNVHYFLWYCNGAFTITDFSAGIDGSDPNCAAIRRRWDKLYSENNISELVLSIDSLEYYASIEVEKSLTSAWGPTVGAYCPNKFLQFHLYRQLCYRYCFELVFPPNPLPFHFKKIICGQVCCKRSTNWCINASGNPDPSDPVFEKIGGSICYPVTTGDVCNGVIFPLNCDSRECGPPPQ